MNRNKLKQMERTPVVVGENTFHIAKFPAFKAANLTGELTSVLVPLFGAFLPLVGEALEKDKTGTDDNGLMDTDVGEAAAVMQNYSGISGDKMELLLKKLLTGGHIIVELENDAGDLEAVAMDDDIANEIFCGEVHEMFILAFHVIRLNFNGFFKRFAAQSGKVGDVVAKVRKML